MHKLSSTMPNPRRVAAGKLNCLKRGPLTTEGRERLRQAAFANRPWDYTTGPKTAAGKARSSQNGKLRQKGEKSVREKKAELAEIHNLVKSMETLRNGMQVVVQNITVCDKVTLR